ncbi:MAG TPA: LPS export ABC transporter periplasmic protein LptC [Terriglobales bacterium]|nr:LPS export ABC transporter periplasmic protein LptC [Terriglobales bacterium]
MPVSIVRLRYWFAGAAIFLVAVVACFYLYARWQSSQVVQVKPKPLGITIQQTTQGFSLSKSEGGRTLFTVRASRAVQFKAGGRALLHDVTIVVYGKQSNRFDQIYGKQFEYDPKSGNVIGIGEVHMDLESNAQGPSGPDQAAPLVVKNPVHVDTSNLTFNQKTGNAATPALVRFTMPQASGSAVGATYDAKSNSLTLSSQFDLTTSGDDAMHIVATHAVMTKIPRQIVLAQPQVNRSDENFTADQGTIFLRDDNTADRLLAVGNVRANTTGDAPTHLQAAQGDFQIAPHNQVQSGVLSGGVYVQATGQQPAEARSRRAYLRFGPKNVLTFIHAAGRVQMVQHRAPSPDGQPQQTALDADAVDFVLKPGNTLDHADTAGRARIVILSANNPQSQPGSHTRTARAKPAGPVHTTVTARTFHATFTEQNRMKTLHGAPDARIVSLTPGLPQRVSTSHILDVAFAPDGQVSNIVQTGDVQYTEAKRAGWAQNAFYDPGDGNLLLTGSPRVVDGGTTTTADSIRMVRPTGQAFAQGHVKSTYSDLKPDPSGAMLAGSDPIHVTSATMSANRNTGIAVYVGAARLWQDGNVVQAPTITFNRNQRTVQAQGDSDHRVATLFVQTDVNGRVTPVNVTSDQLTYRDQIRQANFVGGVMAKTADGTLTSDRATIFLLPRQTTPARKAPANEPGASQLDRIVADGHVVMTQPTRHGQGEHLVYTAAEGKYVLTGGSPSIFDAERGTVQGDSLTFYNRDDTVFVESAASPPIQQSRVAK